MAVALPPDMHKEPPTALPSVAEWRLPSTHAQDLRDVARGLEESDVGIRTRYLSGESTDDHDAGDVHLFELEAFCNRFGIIGPWSNAWRSRIRRCRAALRRLSMAGDGAAVGALHVFYGYPDPSVRQWPRQALDVLGDLAPLLRYTDAVEEVRMGLVKEAVAASELASGFLFDPRAPSSSALRSLSLVVAASALTERDRFFDRVISSGDAVRTALEPFGETLKPRGINEHPEIHKARVRAFGERSSAHAARRRDFLVRGRADAAGILTRASRAFHASWLAASGD